MEGQEGCGAELWRASPTHGSNHLFYTRSFKEYTLGLFMKFQNPKDNKILEFPRDEVE